MSDFITPIQESAIRKVSQLDNRPNVSGGYGQAKLSAEQLKAWFDAYPKVVREKVDEIIAAFSNKNRNGDYIALNLGDDDDKTLADLVNAIFNGEFAAKLIVKIAENDEGENLIAALNGIKGELSKQIATDKIAINAVTESKIANGAVTNDKIQASAVKDYHIEDRNITTTKIAQGGVETYNIAGGAVTGAKISTKAVEKTHLADDLGELIDQSFKAVSYDALSGDLIFTDNAGNEIKLELPLELFVRGGGYDEARRTITLELASGQTIEIPVSDLVTDLAKRTVENMSIETWYQGEGFTNPKYELTLKLNGGASFEIELTSLVPLLSITNNKIADKAVTSEKIASQSVNSTHLGTVLGQSINSALRKLSYNATTGNLEASTDVYGISKTTIALPFSEIKSSQAGLERRIEQLEGLTLKTITDDSVAHEKIVPMGTAPNAVVEKLGGMCVVKKGESNNLCICDGEYDLSTKEVLRLDFGKLEAGEYYLHFEGSNINICYMRFSGAYMLPYYTDSWTFENPMNIVVQSAGNVSIEFESEYYNGGEGNYYMGGTITGIMLCRNSDADKTYKPYPKTELVIAKPTSIESYTRSSNNILPKAQDKDHVLDGKETYSIPLGYLTSGEYYLSFEGNISGLYEMTIGYDAYFNNIINFAVNVAEELYLNIVSENMVDGNGVFLSGTIKNIMLCKYSDNDKTYKPVAEPKIIDTISLPENIEEGIKKAYEDKGVQRDCGWGLGINAEYNNHVVLRNGRIIYRQEVGGVDLGDFNWRKFTNYFTTYASWSPDAWENIDLLENTSGGVAPILICSKYSALPYNEIYAGTKSGISYARTSSYGNSISVVDSAHSSIAQNDFSNYVKGVKMVYPLQNPIETDITHLFTDYEDFLYIEVEPGGTLKFVNEEGTKEDIPSTVTYITKA